MINATVQVIVAHVEVIFFVITSHLLLLAQVISNHQTLSV